MRATIFEEHSSVLAHWWGVGLRGATLVYLDAHLDLQFIEPARLERLRGCATAVELSRLESRHPLDPDRSACYGIEDFLLPAARLGLIARLIWVAPPHVMRVAPSEALRGLQQMEGVTLEELETFHRTAGGWIEGRLLGLDLVLCELAQVPQLDLQGPVVADIDADYFVRVPQDVVWTEPVGVVATLQAIPGLAPELTIARSVGTGFLPLQHRFLADQLAALWEGRQDEAGHWQLLLDQERLWRTGRRADALAGLRRALDRRPDCAASCYAYGLLSADAEVSRRYLARAATLDPAYGDDPLRRLGEFRARFKRLELATVAALQREVTAMQEEDAARQATAWVALGYLYTRFGRLQEAGACDEESRRDSTGHPELALALAKLRIARGDYAGAAGLLERAAADDETRVAAWVHLAECAFARGDDAETRRLGLLAQRAAPAWPMVLERLGAYAQARGDTQEARHLLAEHEELTQRIGRVAARLA